MELLPFFLLLLIGATAVSSSEPAYPGYGADNEAPCGLKEEAAAAAAPVPVPERREEFDGGRILDISHYYREDMPAFESAEGTPGFLRLARSMRNGSDIANFSELRLTAHSGTHVDAPGHVFEHYYDAGFDVDTLDLAVLNGTISSNFDSKSLADRELGWHVIHQLYRVSSQEHFLICKTWCAGPALLVDVPRDSNITGKLHRAPTLFICNYIHQLDIKLTH